MYFINKINITKYGHVIKDLYKLCFQNYRASLISSYKKEQFKLHRSLLGVRGGGGKQPSEQPSLQHLAVMVRINIFRPNFS